MEFLEYGWMALQWLLIIAGIFCTMIGLVTVVQWVRTPNEPNDDSNRINNIMSWWIGLTRPEVMGKAYVAFRQDVMDNIDDVDWANKSFKVPTTPTSVNDILAKDQKNKNKKRNKLKK